MTNRFKQNTENAQTNKTTKSNIQKHLKQWTHIFVNLFWMPHIWLNLLAFSFFLCVCFFRVKFMFVYSNCRWFACLFLVPGLGLAGMAIYLFAKVWEFISHRLGRVILIVLFHFDCDVVFSSFVIIFSTILEQFSFVSCQTCGWSASVLVWTCVNTSAGPCAQGLSCAWSKDQGKERERTWKHESWIPKEKYGNKTESQREKHIKTGIPQ